MKIAKACKQCRGGKRKCTSSGESSADAACLPCKKRNLVCSKSSNLKAALPPRSLIPSAATATAPVRSTFPELPLTPQQISEFVGLYLRFVHDRPHSLFHEASLHENFKAGVVDQCLTLAICAVGCRFAQDWRSRNLHRPLASRSSILFSQQLETISLSNVQTCILLANIYAAERNNALEVLYFGIANRMAYVLRLHETDVQDPPVLREVKCRLWWSLFMADRWGPPGLDLPREIEKSSRMLDHPMDEVDFQGLDSAASHLKGPRRDGLWKHNIALVEILTPIRELNKYLLSAECDPSSVDGRVQSLEQELKDWQEMLPWNRRMNDINLDAHRAVGQGGTFVSLHLGYHHYSTLLFFQYLDTGPESTNTSFDFAEKCRFHALEYSRLLRKARSKNDCHVVFLTIAHMTLVSSSVLLHLLLFGDNSEVQEARTHLIHNFEALVELGKYWSHVDIVIQRLMMFQNTCLRLPHSHRMDGWMVRFLLEHALPFSEKTAESENEITPSPRQPVTTPEKRLADRSEMVNEVFTNWCNAETDAA